MKYYKARINSSAFQDIIVRARNESEAERLAMQEYSHDEYPEFCEFLEVEEQDIIEYKQKNNI